jgi:hypothetical protein
MRTATTTQIKVARTNLSAIENQSLKGYLKPTDSHLETAVKHYLLYNLDILLEVSKHEKMEGDLETAATIIREYEFLSLVNDLNQEVA